MKMIKADQWQSIGMKRSSQAELFTMSKSNWSLTDTGSIIMIILTAVLFIAVFPLACRTPLQPLGVAAIKATSVYFYRF